MTPHPQDAQLTRRLFEKVLDKAEQKLLRCTRGMDDRPLRTEAEARAEYLRLTEGAGG